VQTFRAVLKTDLNIDISENKLRQILNKDPIFLIHQIKPKKFDRRRYITHNYGEITQADLAFVFPDSKNKLKIFLLLIDVFSSKIFIEVLPNKEGKTIKEGLLNIFKRFGAPIYELQTDNGSEFRNKECKALYRKYHILFRVKRPPNKSNFAEAAILRVKRKLYMFLRSSQSNRWTDYIEKVVDGINRIPLKRLGYLSPSEITNEASSVLVDEALKKANLPVIKEETYQNQMQNAKQYEDESKRNKNLLKSGDYVYRNFPDETFTKSFDIKASKCFCYKSNKNFI